MTTQMKIYRRSELETIAPQQDSEGCLFRYKAIWIDGVDDTSDVALLWDRLSRRSSTATSCRSSTTKSGRTSISRLRPTRLGSPRLRRRPDSSGAQTVVAVPRGDLGVAPRAFRRG